MDKKSIDSQFWKQHIYNSIVQLEELLNKNQDSYYVDMHIHSEYSDDGSLTIPEIIEFALDNKLEIISITDHDSMQSYVDLEHEIKNREKNGKTLPIIIPGVEFSVYYKEYGDLCHILKYFVNPSHHEVKSDLLKNKRAYWTRCKKQFSRISENKALQYFVKNKNVDFNFEEYIDFLNANYNIPIPEYPNLAEYIYKKLIEQSISVLNVFDKIEHYNMLDNCLQRKTIKQQAIMRFKNKYLKKETDFSNSRLLLPILATVGIDDDCYPDHASSGNLSVTNYEQLALSDLNKQGITVFAHPTGTKLDLVDQLKDLGNLDGVEVNYRNRHATRDQIINKSQELSVFYVIGSDKHDVEHKFHEDLDFYLLPTQELEKLLNSVKSKFFIGG